MTGERRREEAHLDKQGLVARGGGKVREREGDREKERGQHMLFLSL